MDDERGLYDKYTTEKGSFLLKPKKDMAARAALRAYAAVTPNDLLRVDITAWIDQLDAELAKKGTSHD